MTAYVYDPQRLVPVSWYVHSICANLNQHYLVFLNTFLNLSLIILLTTAIWSDTTSLPITSRKRLSRSFIDTETVSSATVTLYMLIQSDICTLWDQSSYQTTVLNILQCCVAWGCSSPFLCNQKCYERLCLTVVNFIKHIDT